MLLIPQKYADCACYEKSVIVLFAILTFTPLPGLYITSLNNCTRPFLSRTTIRYSWFEFKKKVLS